MTLANSSASAARRTRERDVNAMPVPPPELVVEFTVEPSLRGESDPGTQIEAAKATAERSGLAREAGPERVSLAGGRAEVLGALFEAIEATLDAGARTVRVEAHVPETEVRRAH
jgi:uncharacterized protein YqgV (UPF0045/DUF77 family)